MAIPSEGLRTCRICGIDKPLDDFYLANSRTPQWHMRQCKRCMTKKAMDRYYHKGGQGLVVKRRDTIKDAVFNAYGGYVCACCGETERMFLQLDHVNNDGGDFRRKIKGRQQAAAGIHTYRWLFLNGFPPGYQILCANCNIGKHLNGGACPHQTTSNDQRQRLVGSSEPKRNAPQAGDDMVSSVAKVTAVR